MTRKSNDDRAYELLMKIHEDGVETKTNIAILQTQMKTLIDADLPDRMTKAEAVTGGALWLAGTLVTAIMSGIGWIAHRLGII